MDETIRNTDTTVIQNTKQNNKTIYIYMVVRDSESLGDGAREREREKIRYDNTLLHRDKDLSTCRLFCKSVPDDKHSNTQYIKQKFT